MPGDYDADGKTDLAVWEGATGTWKIWQSATQTERKLDWGSSAAPFNDEPQPGAATPEDRATTEDRMAPADHAEGSSSGNGNGAGASDDYGADKIKVLEGLEAVRRRRFTSPRGSSPPRSPQPF